MIEKLFAPSILAGVAIVAFFISSEQAPERIVVEETSRSVRKIEANFLPFNMVSAGFGIAEPEQTWSAHVHLEIQRLCLNQNWTPSCGQRCNNAKLSNRS